MLKIDPTSIISYHVIPDRQTAHFLPVPSCLPNKIKTMAISPRPDLHSPNSASNPAPYQPLDIEAWTEEATRSLAALSLSSPGSLRRTAEPLVIPLEDLSSRPVDQTQTLHHQNSSSEFRPRPRREPLRRDSFFL